VENVTHQHVPSRDVFPRGIWEIESLFVDVEGASAQKLSSSKFVTDDIPLVVSIQSTVYCSDGLKLNLRVIDTVVPANADAIIDAIQYRILSSGVTVVDWTDGATGTNAGVYDIEATQGGGFIGLVNGCHTVEVRAYESVLVKTSSTETITYYGKTSSLCFQFATLEVGLVVDKEITCEGGNDGVISAILLSGPSSICSDDLLYIFECSVDDGVTWMPVPPSKISSKTIMHSVEPDKQYRVTVDFVGTDPACNNVVSNTVTLSDGWPLRIGCSPNRTSDFTSMDGGITVYAGCASKSFFPIAITPSWNGAIAESGTGPFELTEEGIENGIVFTNMGVGCYAFAASPTGDGCSIQKCCSVFAKLSICTINEPGVTDCDGSTTGSEVRVAISGGSPPYSVSMIGGNLIGDTPLTQFPGGNGCGNMYAYQDVVAGSYTITATDNDPETDEAVAVYFVNDPVPVVPSDIEITESTTCADADGTIFIGNVTGGTPPYEYSIDNGVTFYNSPFFRNVFSGNHEIVARDSKMCLSAPISKTTCPPRQVPLDIVCCIVKDLSCGSVNDGEITVGVCGGLLACDSSTTPFATYSYVLTDSVDGTITKAGTFDGPLLVLGGLKSSSYIFTVSEPTTGLSATKRVLVTTPVVPGSLVVDILYGEEIENCCRRGDGGCEDVGIIGGIVIDSARAVVTGGCPPYTYEWTEIGECCATDKCIDKICTGIECGPPVEYEDDEVVIPPVPGPCMDKCNRLGCTSDRIRGIDKSKRYSVLVTDSTRAVETARTIIKCETGLTTFDECESDSETAPRNIIIGFSTISTIVVIIAIILGVMKSSRQF